MPHIKGCIKHGTRYDAACIYCRIRLILTRLSDEELRLVFAAIQPKNEKE